jgi:hypothetical protein
MALLQLVYAGSNAVVVIGFAWQRDYIAQNLCENRFAEVPICRGSCVLQKDLKKTETEKNKAPEIKHKEILATMPDFFCFVLAPRVELPTTTLNFSYVEVHPEPTAGLIFHPPCQRA